MRSLLWGMTLLLAGCAPRQLPAHVWNEMPGAIVDAFWWIDLNECDLRVVYRDGSTGWKGVWLRDVPTVLCQDAMPIYDIRHPEDMEQVGDPGPRLPAPDTQEKADGNTQQP